MEISTWISLGSVVGVYLLGIATWAFKVEKRIQALELGAVNFGEKLIKIESQLEKLDSKLDDLKELVIKNG